MEPERKADRRWSDERIDDFALLVRKNDERLDNIQNLLAAHDLQLVEIERERRMRLETRQSARLAFGSVIFGQIATIVALIITRIH